VTKKKAVFTTENGSKIEVAENIVAGAVVEAISGIPGLAGLKDGRIDEVISRLARGKSTKSVTIIPKENEDVDIDVHIVVQFRASVPEISNLIKERVKENVEAITGIRAADVMVHINDVSISES